MSLNISPAVGIAAIAAYEPPWALGNDWFQSILPRKFVPHSGIVSRRISQEDEVTMGVHAVENLRRETHCHLGDCAAVVFVASSLFSPVVTENSPNRKQLLRQCSRAAAQQFCQRIGLAAVPVFAINWGCSGYSRAMAIVQRFIVPTIPLRTDQFILVVTVNRTSQIVDFACKQTAPVFGDMAQATLLAESTASGTRYTLPWSMRPRKIGRSTRSSSIFIGGKMSSCPRRTADGVRSLAAWCSR